MESWEPKQLPRRECQWAGRVLPRSLSRALTTAVVPPRWMQCVLLNELAISWAHEALGELSQQEARARGACHDWLHQRSM